jgi:hypothetical protein
MVFSGTVPFYRPRTVRLEEMIVIAEAMTVVETGETETSTGEHTLNLVTVRTQKFVLVCFFVVL